MILAVQLPISICNVISQHAAAKSALAF